MSFSVTILGCGSSSGVPRVGQGWGACDPKNPRNRRRRCSVLARRANEAGQTTQVLVDTSPDLREQLLALDIAYLDGILMTHSHADHTNGIDDVRPLVIQQKKRIEIHMDDATASVVKRAFSYIFETPQGSAYPPLLTARLMTDGGRITVEGPGGAIEALPFRLHHGEIDSFGYRFGGIAYSPDLNAIPDTSVPALENLDVWIVDALRYKKHPSHFCLEETLAWIERLRPRRAILTNLHTDMDFETLRTKLPPGVQPAYDGMIVTA